MKLEELMKGIEYRVAAGNMDIEVTGISYDSRQVRPGHIFVCIPGLKTDGHIFAEQAVKMGASVVLAEKELPLTDATLIITGDCRRSMPKLAANFYRRPSRDLRVVGVTGTNGKTTTTHLIKAILEEQNKKVGIIGTLYARIGDTEKVLGHTTPESVDIEQFLSLTRESRGDYVVMEVSSHAIDLGRVDEIYFAAAVFTNLTQDHLDYHLTMENYKEAKLDLFRKLSSSKGFAVINADDPAALDFIKASGNNFITYGVEKDAAVKAVNVQTSLKGSNFSIVFNHQLIDFNMKLIGLFSVYNALAAISFAIKEGIDFATIKTALEKVEGVAGRFEQVDCGQDFTVVVDYAHTPDGLENILKTGRQIAENRLITVFGCGGDRDKSKRPLMGKIAAQYSDFCVVTSDNPRSEEPEAIINDIIPGLNEIATSHYAKIVDRREAIHHAICLAKKGDLVIIAGKGHETYQLVKDQVLDFDDRKVAAEFLKGNQS